MNAKKKQEKIDMTYINAAALQDHYLRSVNINLKPTQGVNNNRIIKNLKKSQNNRVLQNSAQQILQWGRQHLEEQAQQQEQIQTNQINSTYNSQGFQNNNIHTLSSINSQRIQSENQIGNSHRNNIENINLRQNSMQEGISSNNLNSQSSEQRKNSSQGQRNNKYIRIGHQKIQLNPIDLGKKEKKQFLPPLPHEIDQIRIKEEEKNDKVKMNSYLNKLTLAQRLGIVPAPPKPLTREDWITIEEQSKKRDEGQCPICLEDFKDQGQIILSCSHVFHKQCLESFEKHNKVKTCPICRKQHYDKKHWDDGYKKYIIRCAILIQKRWRGGKARYEFFTDLLNKKYKATSARLRRKILGYKLGKFNSKITTAIEQNSKNTQKVVKQFDENIKKKIEEMYSQMYEIQQLKTKNEKNLNEFLGNEAQIALQNHPDYEKVMDAELNGQRRLKQKIISESEWNEIKNKAINRCDKDCAICFNNLYLNDHLQEENTHVHSEDKQCCSQPNNQKQKKGLYILSCTHIFHANCLTAFERYNLQENQVCPICRSQYQKQHFIFKK
ncbi:anaphase-promoting complex subunit 11 RING-H2 finger protein (macronuclear) [Tetrahymena thermophila SB210]|uniref:Anaphase-promoting complex subunit 11 RING-H2 finger protein n=1 Tax=Tetrahymena thermophila (strain SB210) TaxID=312017 RepID=Q23DE8_TETTS|nr:anaphase-promoting complex subunit 11 RING-H2 finger protein [Tetrahymena thermophila SB210]EAR94468.1 anaphase-promoting complex subunit 11 RING-H2 finger protein [Tetrahymena thermophila SB210]|eukprot:XP_001014738.1 anaphase-promoting complex subunit 11 RING-H2 finger protein [Tetrahymena thermophila SB210]